MDDFSIIVSWNEYHKGGKIRTVTFDVNDKNVAKKISDLLDGCDIKSEYTIYPDRK